MNDRETIMTWLKKCDNGDCSSRCPYDYLGPDKCYITLMIEAVALLKEQLEQKHGHWKKDKYGNVLCSVCGGLAIETISGCLTNRHMTPYLSDYCPHCGVRMTEQERYQMIMSEPLKDISKTMEHVND